MSKGVSTDDALAFAKEEVVYSRDTPINLFGIPVRFLAKQDGRRFAQTLMMRLAESDEQKLALYTDYAAQGWGLADSAMRELIAEMRGKGRQLSPALSDFAAIVATNPPRKLPGQGKERNILRDVAITLIVQRVAERFGIPPTSRGDNPSACRVVASALIVAQILVNHKQVEGIWNRVGKMLRPS